jgi:hypothetical protein
MEPQQQATTERLDGGPEPPLNLAMEPAVVPSQSLSRDQIPLNLDSKYDDKTRSDPTNKILDTSTKY